MELNKRHLPIAPIAADRSSSYSRIGQMTNAKNALKKKMLLRYNAPVSCMIKAP